MLQLQSELRHQCQVLPVRPFRNTGQDSVSESSSNLSVCKLQAPLMSLFSRELWQRKREVWTLLACAYWTCMCVKLSLTMIQIPVPWEKGGEEIGKEEITHSPKGRKCTQRCQEFFIKSYPIRSNYTPSLYTDTHVIISNGTHICVSNVSSYIAYSSVSASLRTGLIWWSFFAPDSVVSW